jgi:hypothetical protein
MNLNFGLITDAIGLLRGDQLHLTPLQTVFQFRPRFDYKDEEDAIKKKASAANKSGGDDMFDDPAAVASDGDEAALPAVQVRVNKRESDRAKEIRRSSHGECPRRQPIFWSAIR